MKTIFALLLLVSVNVQAASFVLGNEPAGNGIARTLLMKRQIKGTKEHPAPHPNATKRILLADVDGFQITNSWGAADLADTRYVVSVDGFNSSNTILGIKTPQTIDLATHRGVQKYLAALGAYKSQFIWYFREHGYPKLDNQLYNKLAGLAFATMGQESDYYQGIKFLAKEEATQGVAFARWVTQEEDRASRGPNQMKNILPSVISFFDSLPGEQLPKITTYPVVRVAKPNFQNWTSDNLMVPEVAAIAAMAHLLGNWEDTARVARKYNHPGINPENIFDYVPYLYKGSQYQVKIQTGNPLTEPYQKNLKNFLRYFVIMEKPYAADSTGLAGGLQR